MAGLHGRRPKGRNSVSKISFEELDGLTGEMLPERAVLSAFYGGGHDGSNIVSNPVCSTQQLQPSGALTAILGTQSQNEICHAAVASSN